MTKHKEVVMFEQFINGKRHSRWFENRTVYTKKDGTKWIGDSFMRSGKKQVDRVDGTYLVIERHARTIVKA